MVFLKKALIIPNQSSASADMLKRIILLAFPVIGSSFMTMAYNFINMIFVGRLGSDAVAAVGSASFFMHLAWGLSALLTVGTGIKVSHAIGAGYHTERKYCADAGPFTS